MKAYAPTDKLEPWPKDKKGEAAYLFRVSLFSVHRYAKMVPSIVN